MLVPGDLDSILNFQKEMDAYTKGLAMPWHILRAHLKKITVIIVKNSTKRTFLETIDIVELLDSIWQICVVSDISFQKIHSKSNSTTQDGGQAWSSSRFSQTEQFFSAICKETSSGL